MTESQAASAAPLSPADATLWSTLAHVGNIVGFLPALLILLVLGRRSEAVRRQATTALNFVLTAVVAWIALWLLGILVRGVASTAPNGVGLPFVLLELLIGLAAFAVWVLLVVLSLVAAVRVTSGVSYRYPLSLHLIK